MAEEWVQRGKRKMQVYAVVRVDHGVHGDEAFSVTQVLATLAEAEAEVARLNRIKAAQDCHYFQLTTRFYPEGRTVGPSPD